MFICYAHDDKKIVYPEILWLRDQGINLWYDEGISAGAEFPEKLGSAILGASLVAFSIKQSFDRQADIRWAKDEILPQIRDLVDKSWRDFTEPYAFALKAEEVIPNDPELKEIFEVISLRINIDSEPAGADVYMKNYRNPEAKWAHMGMKPGASRCLT